MGIKEQITKDLTEAMKARDSGRVEAIRLIRAEVIKKEKEKGAKEIDDSVMIQLLQSMAKQRKESIRLFEQGGRSDLVQKEQAQLVIIEAYLPAQIDDAAVERVVEEVIVETGACSLKDMGRVMGQVMKRLKETGGLVDGGVVNAKVKARLEG